MKYKLMVPLLLIVVLMLAACSADQGTDSTSAQLGTDETTTTATTEIVRNQSYVRTFPSLASLVNVCDVIVVGEVVNSSVNRIDLVSEGYVNVEGEMFSNVSSFYIDVYEIIKGSVPSDMKLKIDLRCGAEVNGSYEIFDPPVPSPIVGEKYVLFLYKPDKFSGREYFEYMFIGSIDGFAKIENGKIIPPPDKHSVIIETTYDSLINEIEKAIIG